MSMVLSIETCVSFADHLRWSQPSACTARRPETTVLSKPCLRSTLDSFWIELPPWLGAHKPRPRTRHRIRSRFSIDGPGRAPEREERLMAREAMEKWQGHPLRWPLSGWRMLCSPPMNLFLSIDATPDIQRKSHLEPTPLPSSCGHGHGRDGPRPHAFAGGLWIPCAGDTFSGKSQARDSRVSQRWHVSSGHL